MWQPIETAPKGRRILVKSDQGTIYAAEWVQNPWTSHEAFSVADLPNGERVICQGVKWHEIPKESEGEA